MSETTDDIKLTDNKEVNAQLIIYFWWIIVLTFASQLIGYFIQFLSGTITAVTLGILALGAINTLIIGGGVKLVQKQISRVSDDYNTEVKEKKEVSERNSELEAENAKLKKEKSDLESEILAIKVDNIEVIEEE